MTATPTTHRAPATKAAPVQWRGRTRDYDLVKEFVIALLVVTVLTVALAALFSSPDEKQITLSTWSRSTPSDFLLTAATELDGTSGTATYGAPYARRCAEARSHLLAEHGRRHAPDRHGARLRGRTALRCPR